MSQTHLMILAVCALAGATLFFSANAVALRVFSRGRLLAILRRRLEEQRAQQLVESIGARADFLLPVCSFYRLALNMCILLLLVEILAHSGNGGPVFADYCLAFLIAIALFWVFSLAIPEAWAKYAGENLLLRSHTLLMFAALPLRPLLAVWRASDSMVRRLAGVEAVPPERKEEQKQDEFLDELEIQKIEGVVDEQQQLMIENILGLRDTTVGEIMTPRTDVTAIEVNTGLHGIVETITKTGHTRMPVYEGNMDNVIGFVYAKDLLTETAASAPQFRLRERLRPAYYVPQTKPMRLLLNEFRNQKLHIAVVLDEFGGTAGIITLEDILEELVGEISDEYEKAEPQPVRRVAPDTLEVDARTYVAELNSRFGLHIPEGDDYDTFAGFVLAHLGAIPQAGAAFDFQGYHFVVTAAEPRRIRTVRITGVPHADVDKG